MPRYLVRIQSRPGLYAQYGPSDITVWAIDEYDAIDKAFRKLQRGPFPDRSRDMWKVLSVTEEQAVE